MRVIESRPPLVRQVYVEAHRLVTEALPGVAYSVDCVDGAVGYGVRQYGDGGWGMAALVPHGQWVSLVFMRGTDLDDGDGLLEGSGAKVRHVKLRAPEQLAERRGALQRLITAAARLNER